jgi:hemerythrin-like domain-containing protein
MLRPPTRVRGVAVGMAPSVPMKRHPALQPLSRDHHVALVAAQRLRRAGAGEETAARDAFLAFWREHGAKHFRVEEDVLLPAFAVHTDPDHECVVRMLMDHVRIRAMAGRLEEGGDPPVEALHELGTMLERHVRLEEREVFPLIENALPPEAAERLVDAVLAAEREAAH